MLRGRFLVAVLVFLWLSGVLSVIIPPHNLFAAPGERAPVATGAATVAREVARSSDVAQPPEIPVSALLTNTAYVEDIAIEGATAWVATRGGLERYALPSGRRERVYTTADGLAEIHARDVAVILGQVIVRTRSHRCQLDGERFECVAADTVPAPTPVLAPRFQDTRISVQREIVGATLIGTAGSGLWLVRDDAAHSPVRLTPSEQICSNHMMAMAEFSGRLYLGSFDEGLCVTDGQGFRRLETEFRMVNDLLSTPHGLFVAANGGLFHSLDGEDFERVEFVSERGVNGLAFDGATVYATTPATLWQLPMVRRDDDGKRLRRRQYWLPGGARAVQKVTVGAGAVWLASEDHGVIRWRDGEFQVFDRAAGMPTSWVMDMSVTDTTLYVTSFRHGLIAVSLDADGAPALSSARQVAGLPDGWLLRSELIGDELWVGTQRGAAQVSDGGVSGVVSATPHPCVHAVIRYGEHTWLATEGGVALAMAR
ncbi:MAG: hypothetical protein Tsb0020_06070 [Haliangiales bacterium]